MIPLVTIFYSILDDKILNEKDLDIVDADMENIMRNCAVRGYRVNNYQDKVPHY